MVYVTILYNYSETKDKNTMINIHVVLYLLHDLVQLLDHPENEADPDQPLEKKVYI